MKINSVETALVNNPIRGAMLRWTANWLYEAACAPQLDRALEVGCGNGEGLRAIARRFRPTALDGFDLDEKQVARAMPRITSLNAQMPVRLWAGDAEQIEAPDATYDAVFEFTIFHHIPDWRRALTEVRRVLRPGGHFLFEELSREAFFETGALGAFLRRTTVHPWDTMFEFSAFKQGLGQAGLKLVALRAHPIMPGWHHGVAVRVDD